MNYYTDNRKNQPESNYYKLQIEESTGRAYSATIWGAESLKAAALTFLHYNQKPDTRYYLTDYLRKFDGHTTLVIAGRIELKLITAPLEFRLIADTYTAHRLTALSLTFSKFARHD